MTMQRTTRRFLTSQSTSLLMRLRSFAGVIALMFCAASPSLVHAQAVPNDAVLEVLVKSSMLTFNDANLTGNYTVLNAVGSKAFREQLPPEKLKAGFKEFAEKQIDLSPAILSKPVWTKPASINKDGLLTVEGHMDTAKFRVTYSFDYIMSDGDWKLIGLKVNTKAPE